MNFSTSNTITNTTIITTTNFMRNIYSKLLVGLLFVLGSVGANAQNVTTNGGSGLAATYADLASAITALNAATITSPVVITLTANETAPLGGYSITQLGGTSTNTITIQGSSTAIVVTAFTPQTAGSTFDALFKIVGGDYITIQNFTMQENAANTTATVASNNMTEFGVLLVHSSATEGAQNNTIQGNIITLNSTNTNSVGVFSTSASSSANAAQDATSTAGTNSNNKVYGNTISNVAYGVWFICPPVTATVFETGNDIGGSSGATGNTITFGNATASSGAWNRSTSTVQGGIIFRNGAGNSVRFNSVTSNSLVYVGSGGLNGIMVSPGTAPTGVTYTSTISDNTVNITTTGVALATGIDFGYGLISTGTIVCSNNNVTVNQSATTTVSAAIIGIKANYAAASSTVNTNTVVVNQSFTATATVTNSSAVTGMTVPSGTTGTPTMNVLGNTITINRSTTVSATFTATMSGTQIGIQATGAATTMNIGAAGGGNANTISIKEAAGGGAGTTTYSSTVTFIDVNAAHATANVVNNTLNTTGSTIRSTGTLQCVNPNATVTALYNIKSNTATIDRVAASGTIAFTLQTTTPSNVADTVSNNNITFTGLAGTTIANGISQLGGPSASGVKSICNNTISISGTNTGTTKGIAWGYSAGAKVSVNSITINCAAPTVIGLDGTSTSAGGNGGIALNTISLTSSTTSPTSMIGITGGSTGPFQINNNTFVALNFTGIVTGSPVVSGIAVSIGTGNNINNNVINNISVGAATSTATPTIDGILISGGVSTNVFKNKIYGITTAATGATTVVNGIRISGGGTTANNIYNNLIGGLTASAATNTDAIRGISITSTSTTTTNNVYYNTILLTGGGGTNFGGTGVFHTASATSTTAALNLRNNVIVNNLTPNGTGLAVAYRRSAGTAGTLANYASTSNNNLFFTGVLGGSANQLIYADGTSTAQTLAAYKAGVFTAGTIAPRDAFSVTENPPFLSTTGSSSNFLHIDPSIATQVESGGSNIATFTDDYDGDTRNVSTPDIGADEGTFILADVTGPSISYTVLANTVCLTDRTLSAVTVTDPSNIDITAGTRPRLYYKKLTNANTFNDNTNATDGWKFVEATGLGGSPFSFTTDYSLLNGGAPVAGDSISYFVVAQDLAATPNVGINSGTFNAAPTSVALTAAAFPLTGTINGYRLLSSIPASVTIGASGTYTTLTGASGLFAAINAGGLGANTVATILDASITETGANALNQITYGCAGSYTLTIVPNTGVTPVLSGNHATALIDLNGADNVIFDGSNSGGSTKDMTISNTNTSGAAIRFINDATSNTVKNSILLGVSTSTTNGTVFFSTSTGSLGNSSNTINNCDIRDGASVPANAVYSSGSAGGPNAANTISNSNIFNFSGSGINLTSTGIGNSWQTTGNSFYNNLGTPPSTAQNGILISGGSSHVISGNFIGGQSASAGGSAWTNSGGVTVNGISLAGVGGSGAVSVQNNTIQNFNMTSTAGAVFNGILISGASTVNAGTTTGNTIGHSSTANSIQNAGGSATSTTIGINSSSTGTVNFSNNTIANFTATGTSTSIGMRGISQTGAGTLTINNNTIHSLTCSAATTSTTTSAVLGIYNTSTIAGQVISNNTIYNLNGNNASGAVTYVQGINLNSSNTSNLGSVYGNKIYGLTNSSSGTPFIIGIDLFLGSWTVYNNFVSIDNGANTNAATIRGILDWPGTTYISNVYFNSVRVGGTAASGSGVSHSYLRSGGGTSTLRNNIFSNFRSGGTGNHYAIGDQNTTPGTLLSSDYNDLYSATSSTVGEWGTGVARDFSQWKISSSGDANSWNVDPLFTSSTNLHIPAATTTPLESGGTAAGGIVKDIDNDDRPGPVPSTNGGATAVDIGADEFDGTPATPMVYVSSTTTQTNTSNVSIGTTNQQVIGIQIVTSGALNPLSVTSFTINTNGTTAPLTDITNAKLWYTGTNSTFATTTQFGATVPAPNGSFNITGTQALAEGTNYFWITYDVPCGATLTNVIDAECNSLTVGSPQTPTVQAPAGSRTIVASAGLSGTKTVGASGDYASITGTGGLFEAINNLGLGGNLTVNILDVAVTETGAVGLNQITSFCGGPYTVTIKPNTGVVTVLSGSFAGPLINLNGADNVTFDGSNSGGSTKDMTISNTNTSGSTIRFINDATSNTVKNSILLGVNSSSASGTVLFSTTTGASGNSSNTINNCDIRDGATVPVNAIYSSGSAGGPNASNTITNNNIFNWTGSGVLVTGTGNGNSWNVSSNNVYQTASRSTALIAILLAGGNNHTVNSNKLYQASGTIGAAYTGISITGSTDGHTVSNNSIGGSTATRSGTALEVTTSSSNLTAILLTVGTTTATNVNSNTISNLSVSTTSTLSSVFGVSVTAGNVNIGTGGGNTFGGGAAAYDTIRNSYDNGIISYSGSGTVAIENNTIGNIAYYRNAGDRTAGIYISGGTATIRKNIVRDINHNGTGTAFSFLPVGIFLSTSTAGNLIDSNLVYNIRNTNTGTSAYTAVGILVASSSTANTISKNRVHTILSDGTGTGSSAGRVFGIYASSTSSTTYANNMIGMGATAGLETRVTGIEDVGTGTNNYYFNSVNVTGTTSAGTNNSYAFNRSGTATVALRNNIFYNARTGGTGFHVAIANTNAAATGWAAGASNYNDVYSSTLSTVGQWLGTAAGNNRDFTGWKASQAAGTPGSGGDANSFSVTVPFVSATDLHIPAATNTPLESGGTAAGGIVKDIDNDDRPGPVPSINGGGTAPDMGADEFDGIPAAVMSYVSSTTTQNTANVATNSTNQQVIGIQVVTTGIVNPLTATSFTLNTNGTTSTADITNAKIWYTGTSSTFATTTQVGSTVAAPSGSFVISGSQVLAEGTNYFWVTYDVPCTATATNVIDAECTDFTIGALQSPTPQAPAGNRTIIIGPVSGTKTVGSGGDYTTLTAAVTAINTSGLSGNTTLSILNNLTEAGAVVINQWAECGVGGYTLTIKPAAGTTPTISASAATAVIVLNGADRVTIDGSNTIGGSTRDMTISNTATSANSAAIWVSSLGTGLGATNNTIKNCIVKAGANGAAANTYGIYAGGTTITTSGTGNDNDNLSIDNNAISKAYYGIYAQAASTGVNDPLTITNNKIGSSTAADYVTFRGMLVSQANNGIIRGNTVFNMVTTEAIVLRAMEFGAGVTNTNITRNKIYNVEYIGTGFRAGQGISVTTTAPANITISNNVIYGLKGHGSGTMTNNSLGIALLGGGGYDVYFNSVNISDNRTSTSSTDLHACMYIASTVTAVNMRENVFSMTAVAGNAAGKTYGIYCLAANSIFTTMNYNDYYAPGTSNRFAGFITSDRTTLGDIQAGFGQNVNSLVADPTFNAATNLVPLAGSPLAAAGENPNTTGISTDYLNASRGTPPTIGAYENAGDGSAPVITYTALSGTCATGNRVLSATITDLTGVPLAGPLQPRIYYRKNAGTWYSSQGVNTGGSGTNGTWDFTIVAADMGGVANPDVISYYVIAQDLASIPNIGSNPSEDLVATDVNTVTIPPSAPNSYLIQLVLAPATYTVGTAGTYPTLSAAVNAYNTSCLTGNVVFELLDASYSPLTGTRSVGETFPITINQNADAGPTKTLTIRPAAGVNATISAAVNNNALIRILGSYVTIDGSNTVGGTTRNLTISNTSTTSPAVIGAGSVGTAPVTNVTMKNSIFINGVNTNSAVIISDATTPGNPGYFNNITFFNNSVQKSYIGIYCNAAVSAGNGSGLLIDSNSLNTSGANAIRYMGIYVQGVDGATVQRNAIGNFDAASDEDDKGIWFATGTINSSVVRNNISNNGYTGINGYGAHGIYVSTGSATANVKVANNSISGLTGDGWDYTSVATDNPIAIALIGTQAGVNVQFNSINLSGNTLNQTSAMSMGIYLAAGSTADVRDNIIVNNLGLLSATGYGAVGVYAVTANTQFTSINYNDYIVNPTGSGNKYLGQIAAAGSGTLLAWQTATGQDANSVSVDPQYTSSTNLALLATSPMIGAGVTIAGITNDYTNSTRNNPPSIGAYEDKIVLSLKAYLQGAYSSGLLQHRANTAQWTTATNAGALSQPYTGAPYSYAGTETVSSGFFANTGGNDPMDWVLVELRDATTPTTVISRRAAIIMENGNVVDVDGVSPISFKGISAGNYFLVLRHRNHLGVRSGTIQLVDGNAATPPTYDFTTAQSQALQDGTITTNAAMAVDGSAYMLWAGNVNQDIYVRATTQTFPPPTKPSDIAVILTILGGDPNATGGYTPGDVNMDGYTRATTQTFPPPSKPSDAAVIISLPLGGSPSATRQEHKVNN